MADINHSVPEKYAALQDLTVEELEKLLYTAEPPTNGEEDEAYYAAIEAVLLQKETENPSGRLPDIDGAWRSFRQDYSVPEATGQRLYEEASVPAKGSSSHKRKTLRRLLPVAAVIAVVLFGSAAVQADGVNLFGALARWTEEHFSFSAVASTTDDYGFSSQSVSTELTDTLAEYGFPTNFAPGWLPEEFDNFEIEAHAVGTFTYIRFQATTDSGEAIFVDFMKFSEEDSFNTMTYEKDDYPVEEYWHGAQRFYIFHNDLGGIVTWSDGTYIIDILADLPSGTMKEIIDSI